MIMAPRRNERATNDYWGFVVADALEQRVIDIIARKKKLDPARVTPASTFEELGIDSLDAADLLFAFEDDFKIVVPDDAAYSMKTVGQVVEGLRPLLKAQPGSPETLGSH